MAVADRCSEQLRPARQRSGDARAGKHRGCRAATTSPLAAAAIQQIMRRRGRNRETASSRVRSGRLWHARRRNRHARQRCSEMQTIDKID